MRTLFVQVSLIAAIAIATTGSVSAQIDSIVVVDVDATTVWIEPQENLPNDGDPTGWTATLYDTAQDDGKGDPDNGSANWEIGQHGVGYGDGDDTTLITDDSSTLSVYTRTEFTVADTSNIVAMRFEVDYDDAFVAWINGTEVYRSPSFPPVGSPIWNNQSSGHEASGTQTLDPPLDWSASISDLVNGTNLLAIGIWNTNGDSSDMTMIPRLTVDFDNTIFSVSPAGALKEEGGSHTFQAELANPAPPVSYQWTQNGAPVGPDSGTYTIPSLTIADSGTYVCTVTDASAKAIFVTPPVALTVVAQGALPMALPALLLLAAVMSCTGAWLVRAVRRV